MIYRVIACHCLPLRVSPPKFPWSSADFFVNLQQENIYFTIGQFYNWTIVLIGPLDNFTIGQLTPAAQSNSQIVKW